MFRSEPAPFKALRALLASTVIIGLIIFAIFAIIVHPWREMAVMPVKTLRSQDLPWDIKGDSPSWNIIVVVRCLF